VNPANKVLTGRRILVVEDEMLNLMMIEGMLEDLGCKSVTAAATVEAAVALIGSQSFDAAVLDVNLNRIHSYPVADALIARGTPFLFSTGYGEHGIDEGYRDRPVLTKPIQFEKLVEIVKRLLPG